MTSEIVEIAKRFSGKVAKPGRSWVEGVGIFTGAMSGRVCGMFQTLQPKEAAAWYTWDDWHAIVIFHFAPERDPFFFDFLWKAMAAQTGCEFCGWLINGSEEETARFSKNYRQVAPADKAE
jgi:hypothetical protein